MLKNGQTYNLLVLTPQDFHLLKSKGTVKIHKYIEKKFNPLVAGVH